MILLAWRFEMGKTRPQRYDRRLHRSMGGLRTSFQEVYPEVPLMFNVFPVSRVALGGGRSLGLAPLGQRGMMIVPALVLARSLSLCLSLSSPLR